jgi:hypothetical protein
MNNKKIRMNKKKPGSFTTIDLDLIKDKNLTSNAKILLIAILSDSDSFELSQTLYCKRLGWEKNQFTRAIEQLEKNGYINRTQIENDKVVPGKKKKGSNRILYFYTVSEYGNLNKDNNDEVKPMNHTNSIPPNDADLETFRELITTNEFYKTALDVIDKNLIENFTKDEVIFRNLLLNLKSESKEIQRIYVDSMINNLKDFHSDKYPESMKKKMINKINQVVYKENRTFNSASIIGANDEAQTYWQQLRSDFINKQNKKRIDSETATLND